jgi:ABC-type antimicrobial peptide transport system permease subunit
MPSYTEWWFAAGEGQRDAVAERLAQRPIASRSVLTAEARGRALATDPVALGIIGALAIGFVAAALFAVLGFVVSAAVSARERVSEFALLRAIGLSPAQLSSWLSLENAVLAAVSLVAGTVLGLLMAWLVLPFVTVTQGGATPYPPVQVAVPWASILILEAIAVVTLVTTVLVLAWLLRRIGLAAVLRTGEE